MLGAAAGNSQGGIYEIYNRFLAEQRVDYGATIGQRERRERECVCVCVCVRACVCVGGGRG